MANVKFIGVDLSKYTLSASSSDGGFPLANLQTYYARDHWRSANNNANQQLVIDFGVAVSCDCLVLDDHNFISIGSAGVYLQGADDSGFSVNLVTPFGPVTTESPVWASFSPVSKRYWRLYFSSSGPLSAIPYLGNWFLGTSCDFAVPYELPAKVANGSYVTVKNRMVDGSLRTAQAFGGSKKVEVQFTLVDNTTRAAFQAFHATVRGGLRPFYYLDADGSTVLYVLLASDYNPVDLVRYNQNSTPVLVMEEQLATLT